MITMLNPNLSPTFAEIDLKAIKHNYQAIRKLTAKPVRILAVIKADAYGHGMLAVARTLNALGVEFFGVSDVKEGMALRKAGIKKPILLLESTLVPLAKYIVDYNLIATVCTLDLAFALNRYAKTKRKTLDVHIKVDTGMGRLGVGYKETENFVDKMFNFPHLSIKGIYTHFPAADTDKHFTRRQIVDLYRLVTRLDRKASIIPYVHTANSAGLIDYPNHILNLARPGLMLYGLYPSSALKKKINLKPVMSVKSRIIFLKKIFKGQSISYGRSFIAKKNLTVATLPIGYNNGYFRSFSNKCHVLIGGARCPVLGRVTMDQIIVDVSKVKSPKIGMEVVILGRQGKETIDADHLAHCAGTINYEIVCSLGNRLPRVYNI